MWVILLDCSGSMEQPFRGDPTFSGRSTQAKAEQKLEAAKIAILERLPGLGSHLVVIYAFNNQPSLVFKGRANEHGPIKSALDPLAPSGGTNIAAALQRAREEADAHPDELVLRVLVVSDGLSDPVSTELAAKDLAKRGATMDVILIDPTDEGKRIAGVIAGPGGGEVQAVTSTAGLEKGIHHNLTRHFEAVEEAASAVGAQERIVASAQSHRSPETENARFTAGYPSAICPETWYSFLVFLHLAEFSDQVRSLIDGHFAQRNQHAGHNVAEVAPSRPLERGSELVFVPRSEGLEFNPQSQKIAWNEDLQEARFRFRTRERIPDHSWVMGTLDIQCQGVVVASLPFGMSVRQGSEQTALVPQPQFQTGGFFRSVFASYSHKDKEIVEALVPVYDALGIVVYLDTRALRGSGGERWKEKLRQYIRASDLFQLYWSQNASESPEVKDEWSYAWTLLGQKGDAFIRPLYWEEHCPELPGELRHLHFEKLDLATILRLGQRPFWSRWGKTIAMALTAVILAVGVYRTWFKIPEVPSQFIQVEALESLPHVHSVERTPAQDQPKRQLIHIQNLHFVERSAFIADLQTKAGDNLSEADIEREWSAFLELVETLQNQQAELLSELVKSHGVKAVFLEGLTEADVESYKRLRVALRNWKRPDDSDALSEFLRQQHRQDSLLLGAASRVDDLEILPAEEPDAMEAANPLKNGRVEFDETAVEHREEAMVQKILSAPNPVSVLILGRDRDLSNNVPSDVEYIRIGLEAGDR